MAGGNVSQNNPPCTCPAGWPVNAAAWAFTSPVRHWRSSAPNPSLMLASAASNRCFAVSAASFICSSDWSFS